MFITTREIPLTGFYVYILINPLNQLPFYVGKGSRARCLDHFREIITKTAKNKHKANTIKKILQQSEDVIIDIVFVTEDEQECFTKEKELIKQYGRRDAKTGILTNQTDGGEGGTGFLPSAQLRKQWSKQRQGKGNGMFGKHHTEETRKKIAIARIEQVNKGNIVPTKHTEQHKQKMRDNNPGGKATSKPIYQISTEGNIIKLWPSMRQAGVSLSITSWRNISVVANKKRPQLVGGFYWRWEGDDDIVDGKLTTINTLELIRNDNGMRAGRPIKQINPTTNEIVFVWKNMCEAAKHLNIDNSGISLAIKQNRQYAGFLWSK